MSLHSAKQSINILKKKTKKKKQKKKKKKKKIRYWDLGRDVDFLANSKAELYQIDI